MNFKLPSLIAFIICQVHPIWAQQQGAIPAQALLPGGWMRPLYAAAAEAWREYFIQAQQATNQLYQQWANMSGNPLSNAMGGLGGLYGFGNFPRPGSSNQPPTPLQGIFNGATQGGLQMSGLLPGKQEANVQAPLQDHVQETKPQAQVQQQATTVKPQTQTHTQNQPKPPQVVLPPVQEAPAVQPQAPQVQAPKPLVQQQNVPFHIPGVPFQAVGQAPGPVGLFGPSNPLGWMG